MLERVSKLARLVAVTLVAGGVAWIGLAWAQDKPKPSGPAAAGTVSSPGKAAADARDAKPAAGAPSDKPAAAKAPPTVLVKAVPVRVGMVTNDVTAVGTLLANEAVTIRPEIDGLIKSIHFNEGQIVGAGARLISLDASEYKARLSQAQADVTLNKQRLQRAKDLFAKKFVSQQALDEAQGNLSRSLAQREEVAARLKKTTIVAPFTGTIGMRSVSAGQYVKAGDNIVRIENIGTIKLDFKVPEAFLSRIKKEQEVQVRVDAYPADTFTGRIYAIQPGLDEQTRTVWLRANVPNDNTKLRPGMFARVSLILEKMGDSIVIPEQAVVPKGNDSLVLKVVNDKAEIVKVNLGARRPGEVQVLEGLVANDVVVTDGQAKLMMMPGAKVMILPAAAPAAAAAPGPAGNGSPVQPAPAKPAGAKS
jgi:membrane fusion protein, multidrug efflux system